MANIGYCQISTVCLARRGYWKHKTVGQIGDTGHAMVRDTHRKKYFSQENHKNLFIWVLIVQIVAPAMPQTIPDVVVLEMKAP